MGGIVLRVPRNGYCYLCSEYFTDWGGFLYSYDSSEYSDYTEYTYKEFIEDVVDDPRYHSWDKLEVMDLSLDEFKAEAKKSSSSKVDFNKYDYMISVGNVKDDEASSLKSWIRTGHTLRGRNFLLQFKRVKKSDFT